MIRNLVFDMGNVLIHYRPASFVKRLGIPEEDQPLLLREVFGSVEWIRLDRGVLAEPEAAAAMCARLPERLHGAVHTLVEDGWWTLELTPVEGMEALVREAKALGYGIYLLSNATLRLPEYFVRIPGSDCFDGRIVSARQKLLKPQPELYLALFRTYSLRPEECFFIDDLNINVEGALWVGMPGTIFDGSVSRLRRTLREAGVPVAAGSGG